MINNEEIPMLPPFKNNQSLAADEVIEIYHHAIPNSWKREMKKQGFNPYCKYMIQQYFIYLNIPLSAPSIFLLTH